jgi:hypothetical protein
MINITRLNEVHYMDERGFIDRSGVNNPIIIIDTHSFRMMGALLDYVNNHEHRWSAMLCIPYGTYLWQVGDSVKMNYDWEEQKVPLGPLSQNTFIPFC